MAKDKIQIVADGPFDIQQIYEIGGSILQVAIEEYEAAANTFAVNAISDNRVRQQYVRHIKEISDQVRQEVASGNMTVKEGAEYCSQLRDRLVVEYRKYTSAYGVAKAESLKPDPKGFDYYLNKYAQDKFGKDFTSLTAEERTEIYYTVLRKAGGGNVEVTTKVRRLQIGARVMLIITAVLATAEVIQADDKVKELARQGSIIGGGLIGGSVAGFAVTPLCGPAAPGCALLVVLIGGSLGGMAGEKINDMYQEELPVFMHWLND